MEDTSLRLVDDRVVDEDGRTQLFFSSVCVFLSTIHERERVKEDNEKERIIREISNDVMESWILEFIISMIDMIYLLSTNSGVERGNWAPWKIICGLNSCKYGKTRLNWTLWNDHIFPCPSLGVSFTSSNHPPTHHLIWFAKLALAVFYLDK